MALFVTVGRITMNFDEVVAIIPKPDKTAILTRLHVAMKTGQVLELNEEESSMMKEFLTKNTKVLQKPSALVT